jgi:hypothetical protein
LKKDSGGTGEGGSTWSGSCAIHQGTLPAKPHVPLKRLPGRGDSERPLAPRRAGEEPETHKQPAAAPQQRQRPYRARYIRPDGMEGERGRIGARTGRSVEAARLEVAGARKRSNSALCREALTMLNFGLLLGNAHRFQLSVLTQGPQQQRWCAGPPPTVVAAIVGSRMLQGDKKIERFSTNPSHVEQMQPLSSEGTDCGGASRSGKPLLPLDSPQHDTASQRD